MLIRQGILDRYLMREALGTWAGVTVVLLAIMLATRFARFLAQAAAGHLPREFLMTVVALSSLQYLVILIPVSLLLAILLTLGRMYRDQEVAAMTGCGVGPGSLYRPFLVLAVCLMALTAALSFQIGPWAGRQADYMVKDARRLVQYTPFEAGRFKEAGQAVFYTASMEPDAGRLETVFAVFHGRDGHHVITAKRGAQEMDGGTGDRVLRLDDGYSYAGEPGRADFDVVKFGSLTTRISPPDFVYLSSKRKIQETGVLIGSDDPEDQAELQWRIAAPLSVLVLALLAVPLSYASPREGRYGKLVLGLMAYLVYANLLAFGQGAIAKDLIPQSVGLWWVHGLMAAVAFWLIGRRVGWRPLPLAAVPGSPGKRRGRRR